MQRLRESTEKVEPRMAGAVSDIKDLSCRIPLYSSEVKSPGQVFHMDQGEASPSVPDERDPDRRCRLEQGDHASKRAGTGAVHRGQPDNSVIHRAGSLSYGFLSIPLIICVVIPQDNLWRRILCRWNCRRDAGNADGAHKDEPLYSCPCKLFHDPFNKKRISCRGCARGILHLSDMVEEVHPCHGTEHCFGIAQVTTKNGDIFLL